MADDTKVKQGFTSFPPLFWLVVLFEFFERGSYYGMMSILSVYMTEHLHFAKESVGLIKGTIQPLLYFLPIISGALADRFGYRKMLMIAFSLLGLGYFLTAQATSYALVFGALVVMGFGAGTFKPIISGSIAKVTDEKNSALGFGIYYWSINLGAFLFPLILVPILKQMDWRYVIIASAIGTAIMLLPTIFFYKDPVKPEKDPAKKQTNIIQTLANAFEIIYSPIVLLYYSMKRKMSTRIIISIILVVIFIYALSDYLKNPVASEKFSRVGFQKGNTTLIFNVDRNMLAPEAFKVKANNAMASRVSLTIYKPREIDQIAPAILDSLQKYPDLASLNESDLKQFIQLSDSKVELSFTRGEPSGKNFEIIREGAEKFKIILNNKQAYLDYQANLQSEIGKYPILAGIQPEDLHKLYEQSNGRSFFILYVVGLIIIALFIITFSIGRNEGSSEETSQRSYTTPFFIIAAIGLVLWLLPGLTILGRIISYVIYITVASLFIIDKSEQPKFVDHAKFLLMIFLYSGFWIMYFQMFDSVLWYVQAYVNAASLNSAVNSFLGFFGLHINWFFDVEHVTVINAGTIILLQLVVSNIVKHTKALPTMIVGIGIATLGMAILSVSTGIWIFMIGIILFSIGEMTAHPKFISYIGLIAPSDRKAMYMGYLFLYGVFGSSIGGIMGAKLYVHFVDNLNQPKVLWLVFSGIGLATIIALLLYNRFLAPKEPSGTSAA
jgi:dipeptide/tripeptide permease